MNVRARRLLSIGFGLVMLAGVVVLVFVALQPDNDTTGRAAFVQARATDCTSTYLTRRIQVLNLRLDAAIYSRISASARSGARRVGNAETTADNLLAAARAKATLAKAVPIPNCKVVLRELDRLGVELPAALVGVARKPPEPPITIPQLIRRLDTEAQRIVTRDRARQIAPPAAPRRGAPTEPRTTPRTPTNPAPAPTPTGAAPAVPPTATVTVPAVPPATPPVTTTQPSIDPPPIDIPPIPIPHLPLLPPLLDFDDTVGALIPEVLADPLCDLVLDGACAPPPSLEGTPASATP